MAVSREENRGTSSNMQTPTWYSTSPRRPFTPSSPASSTASQKFEVKRLLSRPADPARPIAAPMVDPQATVKRSNSLGRTLLRRRPSRNDKQSLASLFSHDPIASEVTPASAYARAYAQRTNMASSRPPEPRHTFEGGRVVALGDPSDSLQTTAIALAGNGKKPEEGVLGLSRKVSARFRRCKNSNPGVLSDGEVEARGWDAPVAHEWSREKERVGLRGIGLSNIALASASNSRAPGAASYSPTISPPHDAPMRRSMNHNRMSRHLSIEDFRNLVRVEYEMGATFEMWDPKAARPEDEHVHERRRVESVGCVRRDPAVARARQVASEKQAVTIGRSLTLGASSKDPVTQRHAQPGTARTDGKDDRSRRRATIVRSDSTSSEAHSPAESISPEKGGKFWRLVKKMSTGTLKEKRPRDAEKAPPVPPLPTSRRSSVLDSGEEARADPATSRASIGRSNYEPGNTAPSIHSGPSSLCGHAPTQKQPHRHPSASRPSMTNESSVVSSSPKSSFGRTHSPRTSMSSYVDLVDEVPPPLPLGKHIVSPVELAQQYAPYASREREQLNASVGASPSLPPPKRPRAPHRPKGEPLSPSTPLASPSFEPVKFKPRPNLLRRPTRLNENTLGVPLRSGSASPRSPRSVSMGMPSPRAHPQAQQPVPRPRSNSLSTVFTFRELGKAGNRGKLTEQEKVAKFEQLLEASEKAGGTLHARLQDRLLSDSLRMSAAYDGSVSEL